MNRGMNTAQSPETAPPGPYLGDESHRSSRAVYRDSLYRESLYRESLYRDSVYRESLYSESLYRDSLYRDSLYRDHWRWELNFNKAVTFFIFWPLAILFSLFSLFSLFHFFHSFHFFHFFQPDLRANHVILSKSGPDWLKINRFWSIWGWKEWKKYSGFRALRYFSFPLFSLFHFFILKKVPALIYGEYTIYQAPHDPLSAKLSNENEKTRKSEKTIGKTSICGVTKWSPHNPYKTLLKWRKSKAADGQTYPATTWM